MPARYTTLPTQQSQNADRELNEAFESDEDDNDNNSHLESAQHNRADTVTLFSLLDSSKCPGDTAIVPTVYDFERNYDYDRPPPGSPPHPLATTVPNDIGNSNGELPSSPLGTTIPRPSFLRRAVGAILPTHYVRVPTNETHTVVTGGGSQNDGVFSNVVAKPAPSAQIQAEDGSIYLVPEESQSIAPPVCRISRSWYILPHSFSSLMRQLRLMPFLLTGIQLSTPLLEWIPMLE